jgi:hypothetical protein
MKKVLFLSAVACSMAFYACKKDNDSNTPVVPPVDTIAAPAIDPVALATNVKIGYGGTRDSGNIPAASADANAPVLDPLYNGITYYAISKRYLVIYPNVTSGYVKGYYLQINGAKSHFKIDYTTAYGVRKAKQHAGMRDDNGNGDSTIVFKLPEGLKGDTFSITYAAYDTLNRVSNPISAIVSIIASPTATDNDALMGEWNLVRTKDDTDEDWDSSYFLGNSYDYYNYICTDNKLVQSNDEGSVSYSSYKEYRFETFQFSANNASNYSDGYTGKELDLETSSCSNLVYTQINGSTWDNYNGGYSYNAATKVLTSIRDEDGTGTNIYTVQYKVKELTASKLLMFEIRTNYDEHDQVEVYYTEYMKKATK